MCWIMRANDLRLAFLSGFFVFRFYIRSLKVVRESFAA